MNYRSSVMLAGDVTLLCQRMIVAIAQCNAEKAN
jgi:hypothetical protein